jgi:hypothetical protein
VVEAAGRAPGVDRQPGIAVWRRELCRTIAYFV